MLKGKLKKTICLMAFGLFLYPSAFFLFGQSSSGTISTQNRTGDSLEIKVAVIGPGDELYFWWGHIGLLIENIDTGKSRFYDWGIFSFENENFFVNFAMGRLLYTCGVSLPEFYFEHYISTNRDITVYTLNLPAEKKEEILRYAEWSILPENKDYLYHHFRDNCATRPRDILDTALEGKFKEKYANESGRFTLRQHVRRHTWFNLFYDWILNFWMSRNIDTPITVWDEMFLPSEIAYRIQEFKYIDASGKEQSLVSTVESINKAVNRPAVLDMPRKQWPIELVFGCVLALLFILLYLLGSQGNKSALNILALGQGALGLFFGLAGVLLFFLMFFTDHDYTHKNINIIFVNPLLLAALPFGIFSIKSQQNRGRWEAAIKILWSCCFCLGIISILINALPFFGQRNQVDLALVMPPAAALSYLPDLFIYIRKEYLWRWLN